MLPLIVLYITGMVIAFIVLILASWKAIEILYFLLEAVPHWNRAIKRNFRIRKRKRRKKAR